MVLYIKHKLALHILCLTCMLCNCTAQTAPSSAKGSTQQNQHKLQLPDDKGHKHTPTYRIISVANAYTLRWTGKAFIGVNKNKANTWLISAVVKGLDTKWLNHTLLIKTKDVEALKDSLQKDAITIIALKSAEKDWNISALNKEYFMVDECKAPLYAVPYFINGSVYVICIIPSFQIMGNEMRPAINRKDLHENILMPLLQSFK